MSKRKPLTTEVSEAVSIHLKKARTEISKYSLVSQNIVLSEKEELDQQANVSEKLTELNLKLDHLSEDNVENIEKYIKQCIKEDRAVTKKHRTFSSSLACLKTVLSFLLRNSETLNDLVIQRIQQCFQANKLEWLNCQKLNEMIEMFMVHTIRTNKIDTRIVTMVKSILRQMHDPKSPTNLLHTMFYKILSDCPRPLDQTLLLGLLSILDDGITNDRRTFELVLNTVFQKRMPDDYEMPNDGFPVFVIRELAEKIQWSVLNLKKLLKTILIVQEVPSMKPFVYESLISRVIFCKKSLTEKKEYHDLHIEAIKIITKELTIVRRAKFELNWREEARNSFALAFIAIIRKHSLNAILNKFFVSLYLTAIDCLQSTEKIQKAFLDTVQGLFEKDLHAREAMWLENCMEHRNPVEDINNLFIHRRLCMIVDEVVVNRSLIKMCMFVMENYVDEELDSNATTANNTSQLFCQFVTKNLVQLTRCKKPFNHTPITSLLNQCFSQKQSQHIFLNQMQLLLKNKQINTLLNEPDNPELDKLRKDIINRVLGNEKPIQRQFHKHIYQFQTFQQAIRLLDSIGSILFWAKQKQLTEMVIYFGELNINTPDIQRFQVYGLLSLLRSVNTNPTLVYPGKRIEINDKISEQIFEVLTKILTRKIQKFSIISELRSVTYQACHAIVCLNSKMIGPIISLLSVQLNKTIIKDGDEVYFDLAKCVSDLNLHLIEPVDVLLHCSDLCVRQSLEQIHNNHMHPTYTQLIQLQTTIKSILNFYQTQTTQQIFTIYTTQRTLLIRKSLLASSPVKSMTIFYKLLMGLIDVMIEHVIGTQQYTKILKMIDLQAETCSLISTEIETLMSQLAPPNTDSLKRKSENKLSETSILKKLRKGLMPGKSTHNDKENQSVANSYVKPTRKPFGDLTNVPCTSKSTTIVPPTIPDKSYINIHFTYVPRISYKCSVKMLQLIQCSDDRETIDLHDLFSDYATRSAMIALITNRRFTDYVFKVIEKKLKVLISECEEIYDPECLTDHNIFTYLSKLWSNLSQRINGTINQTGTSIFTNMSRQLFSQTYFLKTLKFINLSQQIFTIIQNKFQNYSHDLIKNEQTIYTLQQDNISNKTTYNKMCWLYILNCSRTVKLYLTPTGAKSVYASKCCSGLLNLMQTVLKTTNLSVLEYDSICQWLYGLASQSVACDHDSYKSIINFLVYLEGKRSTQAILIKYLLMDYNHYMRMMNEDVDSDDEDDSIESEIRVDSTTQYQLVGAFNAPEYQKLVTNKLYDLLAQLKWTISNSMDLNKKRLLRTILKQLDYTTIGIQKSIMAIFNVDSVGVVLELLTTFYEFVTFLFGSILVQDMDLDEKELIKELCESICERIQKNLWYQWGIISEFIINEEEAHSEKVDISDINRFSKFKKLVGDLEHSIVCFETRVNELNKGIKDVDILAGVKLMSSDNNGGLNLNFNCKLTKTISISQFQMDSNNSEF